ARLELPGCVNPDTLARRIEVHFTASARGVFEDRAVEHVAPRLDRRGHSPEHLFPVAYVAVLVDQDNPAPRLNAPDRVHDLLWLVLAADIGCHDQHSVPANLWEVDLFNVGQAGSLDQASLHRARSEQLPRVVLHALTDKPIGQEVTAV